MDIEEMKADLERRELELRRDRTRFALEQGLIGAKCRPEGLSDATLLLASLVKPEFDKDGRITKLDMDGKAYGSAQDAAAAFMAERTYYAAGEAPKAPAERSESGLSPAELGALGWMQAPPENKGI